MYNLGSGTRLTEIRVAHVLTQRYGRASRTMWPISIIYGAARPADTIQDGYDTAQQAYGMRAASDFSK